jgi:hypothetical protein
MFQYKLAEAFSKPRGELLASMSAKEYSYWKAYYSIYPFPERRADMRAASILQGVFAGPQKKRFTFEDCILSFLPKAPMSDDQIKNVLMAVFKGRIKIVKKNEPKT